MTGTSEHKPQAVHRSYPLASSSWDGTERAAIERVLDSGRTTMGPEVRLFEERFAETFDSRFAVMVNSGSSANLLAIAALSYVKNQALRPGDEVIVPAISWGTTYYPLHQHGLKMRIVDIDIDTLNFDLDQVEAAISDKTRAIMAVNLLGNPNDFDRLQAICDKHNLMLIEDNCESMGAKYKGKACGSFGRCGTFSSFFSHHICTIEGGIVVTDDEELYHVMLSLRAHGWTRDLPSESSLMDEAARDPFSGAFHFILPGYNLRPNEIFAALGQTQLDKLPAFIEQRRRNASYFFERMEGFSQIRVQKETEESSSFGFSLILEEELAGQRAALVKRLKAQGIECRPVIAGNIARHPVFAHLNAEICGSLYAADKVHSDGFFVGNSHEDLRPAIDWLCQNLA